MNILNSSSHSLIPSFQITVAGSVIQATGRTDFEDDSKIGNQSEVRKSLQRIRTIPEINVSIDPESGRHRQTLPEANQ